MLAKYDVSLKTMMEVMEETIIGQKEAKRCLALSLHNHMNNIGTRMPVLLIGPSGSGKTSLASLLPQHLNLPFISVDATSMVATGYVGVTFTDILNNLYKKYNGKISDIENAIVHIDEFDKLATSDQSNNNVNTTAVLNELLRPLEGYTYTFTPKDSDNDKRVTISTSKMTFIATGAFDGMDLSSGNINPNLLFDIEMPPQSMAAVADKCVKYGISSQIMARFSLIATLDELDKEAFYNILINRKGSSPLAQIYDFFRFHGKHIFIREGTLEHLCEQTEAMQLGVRQLKTRITELARNLYFELSEQDEKTRFFCIKDEEFKWSLEPMKNMPSYLKYRILDSNGAGERANRKMLILKLSCGYESADINIQNWLENRIQKDKSQHIQILNVFEYLIENRLKLDKLYALATDEPGIKWRTMLERLKNPAENKEHQWDLLPMDA